MSGLELSKQEIKILGSCESGTFRIWIGGPISEVERACAEFCTERGFCVAIEPVRYVYTGAREDGVVVTVLNYPRFPKSLGELRSVSNELAEFLIKRGYQRSATVEGPDQSSYLSRMESST